MKRIISIILSVCLVLCCMGASLTLSADYGEPQAIAYLVMGEENVKAGDSVEVSVVIEAASDFVLSGTEFSIYYGYEYKHYYKPLYTYSEGSAAFNKSFNAHDFKVSGTAIKVLADADNGMEFKAGETKTLVSFTIDVNEDIYNGNYIFSLMFDDLYFFSAEDREIYDIELYENYIQTPLFVGDVYGGGIPATFGGKDSQSRDIYVDYPVTASNCFIDNTNVLSLDNNKKGYQNGVLTEEDYSWIAVFGANIGTAILYIESGQETDNRKIDAVKIEVIAPQLYPSEPFVKKPDITEYYVGEKFDITGFEMRLSYDNSEQITPKTDEYIVGNYDFSTPGEKKIKISYTDKFWTKTTTEIKVTVKDIPPLIEGISEIGKDVIRFNKDNISIEEVLSSPDENCSVRFFKDGEEVSDGLIRTGMTVELTLASRYVKKYTVAVAYDLNGDGKAGINDLVILKNAALGEIVLDSTFLAALGNDGDTVPNAVNIVAMKKYLLGV